MQTSQVGKDSSWKKSREGCRGRGRALSAASSKKSRSLKDGRKLLESRNRPDCVELTAGHARHRAKAGEMSGILSLIGSQMRIRIVMAFTVACSEQKEALWIGSSY